jgi:hypothetical protein
MDSDHPGSVETLNTESSRVSGGGNEPHEEEPELSFSVSLGPLADTCNDF